MEGSSLTNEEIEAALQLIQLISSDPRIASYRKSKLEEESVDDSTSAAYASSPPEKIVGKKSRSLGERKRKLRNTRAQLRNEANAAQQLLQLSEEEEESGGNISDTSYITDASSAAAAARETRLDTERESEAKRGGGGGRRKSDGRGLCSVVEEGEGEFMEEECLADIFCRRRNRKFRSLTDIYTATKPSNAVDF